MSKRWHNVVNPDDVISEYGADAFRMYEMFLGPLEDHKPWDTQGIDGVSKFLRKFWRLFENNKEEFEISGEKPNEKELKVLHQAIKKVGADIDRLSLNTAVSAFMVCTNELQSLKCNKREILEPLVRLIAPFAPHIAEELWHSALGKEGTVHHAKWPELKSAYLQESSFEYPVMVNGKMRTKITFPLDKGKEEIEEEVLQNEVVQKWLNGNEPKKVIVVPGKIVNVVV
jgi:leucyl-tRNA synthetase